MKILYAIQGTGNGHVSRARDIYPELLKYGNVDVLISGTQSDIDLPFPVKYKFKGLCFVFGKKGGVSLWETFRILNPIRFFSDALHLPVKQYDLVVNDFEPVSAWACKFYNVPCFALSHQSAVIHKAAPKSVKSGWVGRVILKHYAPFTDFCGFHFDSYDKKIFPPVIRKEIQNASISTQKHYTVYLPSYDDNEIIRFFHRFKDVEWQVFSKHNKEAFRFENISIQPINNDKFIESLASCTGAILGAGFEGPAEALYLQKKLMVVPMKRQFEQQCNAAAIHTLGVPVINGISSKTLKAVRKWIDENSELSFSFPKETAQRAVERLIDSYYQKTAQTNGSVPGFYT